MSRDADKSGGRLVIGGPAQANLLPPEVGAAAQGRILRRNAIVIIIIAVLVVIAGYAGASVLSIASQAQLDAANTRTQDLIAQQNKYAEVKRVTSLLATGKSAQKVGMSTEIDWKAFLTDIQGSLPSGTLVTNFTAETATPLVDFTQPAVPLQGSRIGEITFTATSKSLPSVEVWLDALAKLHGYVDATPGSIVLNKESKLYEVAITMHINQDAFLDRFDDVALAARDASRKKQDEANGVQSPPAPEPSPSPSSSNSSNGG